MIARDHRDLIAEIVCDRRLLGQNSLTRFTMKQLEDHLARLIPTHLPGDFIGRGPLEERAPVDMIWIVAGSAHAQHFVSEPAMTRIVDMPEDFRPERIAA